MKGIGRSIALLSTGVLLYTVAFSSFTALAAPELPESNDSQRHESDCHELSEAAGEYYSGDIAFAYSGGSL